MACRPLAAVLSSDSACFGYSGPPLDQGVCEHPAPPNGVCSCLCAPGQPCAFTDSV